MALNRPFFERARGKDKDVATNKGLTGWIIFFIFVLFVLGVLAINITLSDWSFTVSLNLTKNFTEALPIP